MTKLYLIIYLLFFYNCINILGQSVADSLTMHIEEVVVTATRTLSILDNTASNVSIIKKAEIDNLPSQKIDNILEMTSGVNVHRPLGMYSIRPSVTLRGIDGSEQSRTLVLLNNVPINTSDEGGVNWNRINQNIVEKIEVLKGSSSAIYGNNAMGGVINIITRKPVRKIESDVGISYGTFNTSSSNLYVGSKIKPNLSFAIAGFYQNSDGYNNIPKENRTSPDYSVPRYLNEGSISTFVYYDISPNLNIDFQYDFYSDNRGEGEKIIATTGEYRQFRTNFYKIGFSGGKNKLHYNGNLFYQRENYFRLDERIKGSDYSRFDVESERLDYGVNFISHYQIEDHKFSIGLENKQGGVNGGDFYTTSADFIINKGSLISNAVFGIYEYHSSTNKFHLMSSIRLDNVQFKNGEYIASGNNVDYWLNYNPKLPNREWNHLSPKISAKYKFSKTFNIYTTYSHGFRASILDDLCRSGWMWVGPKIANPDLGPEYIDNFETGLNKTISRFTLKYALYHIIGNDFLYYVSTGDSLFGRDVYRRENIGIVKSTGTEFDIQYKAHTSLITRLNYTFNNSKIATFVKNPELEGKVLKYSPQNKITASLTWTNKIFNCGLSLLFKDKQYTTDDNTKHLDGYYTMGLQLSKAVFKEKLRFELSIIDLLDNEHMETIDYISPGRFMTLKMNYKI